VRNSAPEAEAVVVTSAAEAVEHQSLIRHE